MIYGFIFAFLVALGQRYKLYDDNHHGSLWPKALSWPITLLSVMGLGGYFIFAWNCKKKQDCNDTHSYISFIPVSKSSL